MGGRPDGLKGSVMSYRMAIGVTVVAALCAALVGAQAHDESKYPDWGGQWKRPRGIGTQWDQTKPLGRAQEAPLTPEFQAVLEASIKDQASGGQGNDPHVTCVSNGVPRIMTATQYREFVAAETEKFGKIVAQANIKVEN